MTRNDNNTIQDNQIEQIPHPNISAQHTIEFEGKTIIIKNGITRICDPDGFYGTIMYCGPVASAKKPNDVYAGIAWDDISRGKHDGSVISRVSGERVRHFSYPKGRPSFIQSMNDEDGSSVG